MNTPQQRRIPFSKLVRDAIKSWFMGATPARFPFSAYVSTHQRAHAVRQWGQRLAKFSDKAQKRFAAAFDMQQGLMHENRLRAVALGKCPGSDDAPHGRSERKRKTVVIPLNSLGSDAPRHGLRHPHLGRGTARRFQVYSRHLSSALADGFSNFLIIVP